MIALIRQAIRELHIDIEPHNRELDIKQTDGAHIVSGTNRKGDSFALKVKDDTPYPQIVKDLKSAWRG